MVVLAMWPTLGRYLSHPYAVVRSPHGTPAVAAISAIQPLIPRQLETLVIDWLGARKPIEIVLLLTALLGAFGLLAAMASV